MNASEFLAKLHGVRETSNGWETHGPSHQDDRASLSVTEAKDGRILLHCHAGCSTESVIAALGLKLADLFQPVQKRRIVKPMTTDERAIALQCVVTSRKISDNDVPIRFGLAVGLEFEGYP